MLERWAFGVLFRTARGADAQSIAAPLDERDEVVSVCQLLLGGRETLIDGGVVAAQREHVGDALALHPVEDLTGAIRIVRAREVSHRLDVVVPLDPRHQVERLLARAYAVRHRDPVGRVSGEGRDRVLEELDLALVARRHELERDGRPAAPQHFGDPHRPGNFTAECARLRRGASRAGRRGAPGLRAPGACLPPCGRAIAPP